MSNAAAAIPKNVIQDHWAPNQWTLTLREATVALSLAVLLAFLFWWPLFLGGGLQGGDIYSYYMPQKSLLADGLQEGILPLWNDVAGYGYPAAAESQTGVLYLPNLLLYRFLSINSAYVVSQLGHYIFAFLMTWGLARQLRLSQSAAAIVSLSFVYGWFPPRICLEWAIIGGMYFSGLLWMGVAWLQTGRPHYWLLGVIGLGLFLTAGHFHLAFATMIALSLLAMSGMVRPKTFSDGPGHIPESRRRVLWLIAGLCLGFQVAAVQLYPSWELKQIGQRRSAGTSFDPGYGHIPPTAYSQLIAPWLWHGVSISADQRLGEQTFLRYPAATNKVEAHLYAGLIPLLLALGLCFNRRKHPPPFAYGPWLIIGATGLSLATGWPLVLLKGLPGFGFFMGPGRYGILAAIAISILAGAGWDKFATRWNGSRIRSIAATLVLLVTSLDLWGVSREYTPNFGGSYGRIVYYALLMDSPAIEYRSESTFRQLLTRRRSDVRLYAPGANIPSLTGVSSLPVYLGLGPEIYFEANQQIRFTQQSPVEISAAVERLREWGVTHLLLQEKLDITGWSVIPQLEIFDPLLNRAFARPQPFYLYELEGAPGRVRLQGAGTIDTFTSRPNRVTVTYTAEAATELTLADLNLPGWSVELDGELIEMHPDERFRVISAPAGSHVVEWRYSPLSIKLGLFHSCTILFLLIPLTRHLHRQRLRQQG